MRETPARLQPAPRAAAYQRARASTHPTRYPCVPRTCEIGAFRAPDKLIRSPVRLRLPGFFAEFLGQPLFHTVACLLVLLFEVSPEILQIAFALFHLSFCGQWAIGGALNGV